MQDKKLSGIARRVFVYLQGAQTREEAAKGVESLVFEVFRWAEEVLVMHGVGPEIGSPATLRGFLRWMRREWGSAAEPGPPGGQWTPTPSSHFQGACWCGVLPGTEGQGLAKRRAIPARGGVPRLSYDEDIDESDAVGGLND